MKTSQVCEPEDLVSIERYLGSGAIKGVGAALAGRIVKKFKEDHVPHHRRRAGASGGDQRGSANGRPREIAVQAEEKKDMRQAMLYLQKYGISATLAAKIYQHYGRNIYRVIERNPYRLADDVAGVGLRPPMRSRPK